MRSRGARTGGYVGAVVVGVGLGAVIGFTALVSGMCNTWGQQCTAEETAEMERLWNLAFATPFAVVGGWALLDLLVLSRRRD